MSLWVSVYILALFSIASAVPVNVDEAEHREAEESVSEKVTDWRSSAVLPVLLNPFSVTKLTCGSTITLYDGNDPDTTIEVDICLTALLVVKLLVVISFLLETQGITIQGGLFGILDTLGEGLARLDDSGPEGEPFASLAQRTSDDITLPNQSGANYGQAQGPNSYSGFGFNSWNSGEFGGTSNLPRSFSTFGKLQKYVKQTIVELDKAVKITHHHQD